MLTCREMSHLPTSRDSRLSVSSTEKNRDLKTFHLKMNLLGIHLINQQSLALNFVVEDK